MAIIYCPSEGSWTELGLGLELKLHFRTGGFFGVHNSIANPVILICLADMGIGDSEVLVDAAMTDEFAPTKLEKLISGLVCVLMLKIIAVGTKTWYTLVQLEFEKRS